MQISLTTEAEPFKKEDINKRPCDSYDERRDSRYSTFAYDEGATLQKKSKDAKFILYIL